MKKFRTLCLVAMSALSTAVMAQSYNMDVNLRSGGVSSFAADDVTDVTFSEASSLPADAGNIKMTVMGDGNFVLSIAPIKNATAYHWTKDGADLQTNTALSLYVDEAGTYAVAGVNDDGEGKASPELKVAPVELVANILTPELMPDAAMRTYVSTTFAGGADSLSSIQAAAVTGTFGPINRCYNLKGIEYFIGIDSLQMESYKGKAANLTKNVNLKKINFYYSTYIDSLDIAGLNELERLNISYTNLKQFDISQLPEGMKELDLDELQYESLDVSRFPNLEILSAQLNQLSGDFDFSGMKQLRDLYLASNSGLTSVDVTGCSELRRLALSFAALTSLDVSTCPLLEELYTNYTQISNIDLSVQRATLRVFNPFRSQLTRLDIKNMPRLEMCQASGCPLAENPDLTGCVSLKNLHLEETGITSVDVSGCKNMEELNIYSDSIESIALEDMPNLYNVNIFGNPRQKTLTLKNLPSVRYLSTYNLEQVERIDISTVNHNAWMSLFNCPKLKEIKVWPEFDIDNPPSNVSKDDTAKFVYEFSEE